MPARSCLFSSSSSATLRSRYVKWAFRLSREFWAAIRFLCARASLRSSGVTSERERFRGGPASDVDAGEGASAGGDGSEIDSGENDESAERFMFACEENVNVEIRGEGCNTNEGLVLYEKS